MSKTKITTVETPTGTATVESPSRKAFLLRIAPALHDAMSTLAESEQRSLNGEITRAIINHLRAHGREA